MQLALASVSLQQTSEALGCFFSSCPLFCLGHYQHGCILYKLYEHLQL